jgi:hypothetical protein
VEGRPIVWDRFNRKHLTLGHPERAITVSDVEEVLASVTTGMTRSEITTRSSVARELGAG